MNAEGKAKAGGKTPARLLFFPAAVLAVYAALFVLMPEKAWLALESSGSVFRNMLLPLGLVLVLMILLNIFLKPAQVAGILGKGSGIKGVLLPLAAGIISTGPIYVWYPLLRNLKSQGAGNYPIAIFMYNRAVKPFLLPVMVGYFGWQYVVVLTVFMVLGSFVIGYGIDFLTREHEGSPTAEHSLYS